MIFEYTKNGEKVTNDYYEEGYTTFCYFENKDNEVVFLRMVDKCTGESTTHVFDNVNGEVFTKDYIYFVKVTDTNENIIVEENTRIYNCDAHTKVYGVCADGKCKVEVLSVERANERFAIMKLGSVKYGSVGVNYDYPEGFNKNNSIVLSFMGNGELSPGNFIITLKDNAISVEVNNSVSNAILVLMKMEF